MWLLANCQQLILKALLYSRFLLLLLNKKRRKNKYLFDRNRKAKIGKALFEHIFLIISIHWYNLYFLKISIDIWGKNHIDKSKKNNLKLNSSKIDKNKGANNLSTNTNIANTDEKVNNPNISKDIIDVNKRADLNLSINIKNANNKADDLSIGIIEKNRKTNNLSIGKKKNKRVYNPNIYTKIAKADGQITKSNNAYMSNMVSRSTIC